MRRRHSRVKETRYRKRGSGFATNCSFATNCWRSRKQIRKGGSNIFINFGVYKKSFKKIVNKIKRKPKDKLFVKEFVELNIFSLILHK